MLTEHNRAFKEWALVCEAMKAGRQTTLIRKGGIREEDGIFQVNDPEFFLMPTYEHQTSTLIQSSFIEPLKAIQARGFDPRNVTLDAYAVVDTIRTCDDEGRLALLSNEHIWNEQYLKMRLDYNPYDPLYIMILRVYKLPEPVTLPMTHEYGGCKSWVTLDRVLSTHGAEPAISDTEFAGRRKKLLSVLGGT
jgi:hypothetical protein